MNKRVDIIYKIVIIIVIALVCSIYFYSQLIHIEVPIHSDDAATAADIRDMILFGKSSWNHWFELLNGWGNILFYYLFGATEKAIQTFFSFKYFLCISLTIYLALYNKKQIIWWLLPFFVFWIMPGNFGTASIQPLKFHVWTIFVPLVCLAYIWKRQLTFNKIKLCDILFIIFMALYGLVEKDILILVTLWMPLLSSVIIYFIQKGYIRKYLKTFLMLSSLILLLGYIFFRNIQYQGYGASSFVTVNDIVNNLFLAITGLFDLFNIDIFGKNILQFNTFVLLIRIIILIFGIWSIIITLKEIIVKKIENVNFVDAVLSISVIIVLVAYIFGGVRVDEISNRYMAYIYYIMPILMCHKLYELFDDFDVKIKLKNININSFSVFFIVCIIISINHVSFARETNSTDKLAESLKDIEGIDFGLGSFWSSTVLSVLTEYDLEIQPITIDNRDIAEPYLTVFECYNDGNKFFNFFIEDPEESFGINKEYLISRYGSFTKELEIEGKKIYIYDYELNL